MRHGSGPILLLTGPPGSGKTTVARILAAGHEQAVHLESDRFFAFIAGGYMAPWRPESHAQNELVMRIVCDAAASYARGGYFTIVDGILVPGWFFEPLRDGLNARGLRVGYAILRPSLAIAVSRAQGRGQSPAMDPAVVEQLWSAFNDLGSLEAHVIDNSHQDADQTASTVADRLDQGQPETF